MLFNPPLQEAILTGRSKRFFGHCDLNGQMLDAHCVNTGSMKGVLKTPQRAWLSPATNPARKLRYTLEILEVDGVLVGVNTHRTNKIAHEALLAGWVPGLEGGIITPESVIDDGRIDFLVDQGGCLTYIEVKNVSLNEEGVARFPDSPTERGQKHLRALTRLVEEGHRAIMLYISQREDVTSFEAAADIDPEYARLLEEARDMGVEVSAFGCAVSASEIVINRALKAL